MFSPGFFEGEWRRGIADARDNLAPCFDIIQPISRRRR
jgi:hypothetical protein